METLERLRDLLLRAQEFTLGSDGHLFLRGGQVPIGADLKALANLSESIPEAYRRLLVDDQSLEHVDYLGTDGRIRTVAQELTDRGGATMGSR